MLYYRIQAYNTGYTLLKTRGTQLYIFSELQSLKTLFPIVILCSDHCTNNKHEYHMCTCCKNLKTTSAISFLCNAIPKCNSVQNTSLKSIIQYFPYGGPWRRGLGRAWLIFESLLKRWEGRKGFPLGLIRVIQRIIPVLSAAFGWSMLGFLTGFLDPERRCWNPYL